MNNIVHIAFFVAFSFSAVTLVFQLSLYRYKQDRKYSFRNELPFELVQGTDVKFTNYHYILLFIVALAQILFAFNYLSQIYSWYEYLLVGSLALSAIMFYLLFFVKVFEIKKHIIVVILQTLAVVTSYFAFGLFAHISPFGKQNIVFGIIGYVIAALSLLTLLNPRLRRWPIMDKRVQQDGTILILRPKYFMLALYEWGFIALQFLLMIIMYVYLYI
ncbi:MAG: hypothetical protein BWY30_00045 [Tenericutes bacterium ADurb.Bin239]|jgi:hypothetical protein|nr:MAG: hypothetical protein BWY30_00045 [Tenericutes bacterium ADurb.Bin239]